MTDAKGKKFLEWLDHEIDKLKEKSDEEKLFVHGKLSEALWIKANYLKMEGNE